MINPIFSLLLLAFALSLDGFGVGITYGLRKLKIPLPSVLIISLCSGVVMCVSMQVGVLLAKVVSPHIASLIGAVIILLMGCWSLIQLVVQKDEEKTEEETVGIPGNAENHGPVSLAVTDGTSEKEPEKSAVFSLELRRLGIVVQILRTPSSADMDKSGSISPVEALVLGIALSLDAFGTGLGAALLGFNPLWTSLVIALFSGSILLLGLHTGLRFAGTSWMKHASVLPALLLIAIGILKLL
ncbi:putative sporulation protein YtaF [Paenibacillus sophorae]|uniref:MntP/YtaF family protein n=1 Tax=Paenibacillus sophorae TaxID=1333845 RepID=A0A1H8ML66_9BACL|nr:MntP/YtaF family protein [Paenibacillus sophorae]QWU17862.1 MntP/YtaF family protein [Paenibacillus sophorae]SEO18125.1 putative sporulation protein YtaF [Paenibacillus sophorae]